MSFYSLLDHQKQLKKLNFSPWKLNLRRQSKNLSKLLVAKNKTITKKKRRLRWLRLTIKSSNYKNQHQLNLHFG